MGELCGPIDPLIIAQVLTCVIFIKGAVWLRLLHGCSWCIIVCVVFLLSHAWVNWCSYAWKGKEKGVPMKWVPKLIMHRLWLLLDLGLTFGSRFESCFCNIAWLSVLDVALGALWFLLYYSCCIKALVVYSVHLSGRFLCNSWGKWFYYFIVVYSWYLDSSLYHI